MTDRVVWRDFEPEPDTTSDGSGDPEKYVLTIVHRSGLGELENIATIVHRTCDGRWPIDGYVANLKRHNAQVICDGLNAFGGYLRLWTPEGPIGESKNYRDPYPGT